MWKRAKYPELKLRISSFEKPCSSYSSPRINLNAALYEFFFLRASQKIKFSSFPARGHSNKCNGCRQHFLPTVRK
jgi:hypothetical protein